MKKLVLMFLFFTIKVISYAQCNLYRNDFSSNVGLIQSVGNNANEIQGSTGSLLFTNVPGFPRDVRVSQSLSTPLGNTWFGSFTFKVSSIGGAGGALLPFVVTAGNDAPSNPANQQFTHTRQDAIGVSCGTPHGSTSPITLTPFVKNDSTAINTGCSITIQPNITYTVNIQRLSSTKGNLTVIDNNRKVVGTCCFNIPAEVTGLSVVQAANFVQADAARRISGSADNFCIRSTDLPTCCIREIDGLTQICDSNQSTTYSVEGSPSTNYVWTVSAGITFTGQGTNSINITNWGTTHGNATISVTRDCNCQSYTSTIVVAVRRNLDPFTPFELVDQETSGLLITKIKLAATNTATPSGAIQWWNIFEAANCTAGDYSILNESSSPTLLRNTGFSTGYTITTPPNDLLKSKCYIIKHGMYYENSVCGWKEKRMKIMVNGGNLKVAVGTFKNARLEQYQSKMLHQSKEK